ncbi:MAG: STAS/SEC14 domain-containing protein [Rhodospirillaceae bacterium]|nr:STAS/SEC14 domain-containing protein [Rhodospirillaceae bacterium]
MITEMKDLPKGTVGFAAAGKVTDADYRDVLIPAIESALKDGGKLRLLYLLGPEFDGYAPSAMWDDTLFGARHFFDFAKIACVTDNETYATLVRSFGFLMPAAVRVFAVKDLDAAKAWLAE